jgi:hypothetical protein
MTDDTERRLRESLRSASLPGAPESLHDALRAVAASPAAVPPHRTWLRALPALAAVVVLAILAGVISGGFGRFGPAVANGSPSGVASGAPSLGPSGVPSQTPMPTPTIPPSPAAPATSVQLLDAAALRADIGAVRSGTVVAHDVVVNVGADPTRLPTPTTRECADPLGTCSVVGVLDGFDAATGVITTRAEAQTLPPPTDAADLRAPLALRLVPGGPIELLGHVDLAGGSGVLDTAGLKALTATATPGHVVAVLAWLQSALSPSCGPAMPDDVPNPFICPGEASVLTDTPTPVSHGNGWSIPDSAVRVQYAGYHQFAPSPFEEGDAGVPRRGLYLVRMVAVDNADCQACRGWLAVGRLDAQPASASASDSPAVNAGVKVYAAAELASLLAGGRAAWVGKAVLVDGQLTQAAEGPCSTPPPGCPIGTLAGTSERVVGTPYTLALLGGTGPSPNADMAVRVLDQGLEYLGWMGSAGGQDFQATVGDLAGEISNPASGPLTFIVSAWLGWSGPLPCPLVPGSPPPEDTPFATCPSAWLAGTATPLGTTSPPVDAVAVQWQAYQAFAPGATVGSAEPKYGTYLVRLVADTRKGPDGPRGWQIVARLSP